MWTVYGPSRTSRTRSTGSTVTSSSVNRTRMRAPGSARACARPRAAGSSSAPSVKHNTLRSAPVRFGPGPDSSGERRILTGRSCPPLPAAGEPNPGVPVLSLSPRLWLMLLTQCSRRSAVWFRFWSCWSLIGSAFTPASRAGPVPVRFGLGSRPLWALCSREVC